MRCFERWRWKCGELEIAVMHGALQRKVLAAGEEEAGGILKIIFALSLVEFADMTGCVYCMYLLCIPFNLLNYLLGLL